MIKMQKTGKFKKVKTAEQMDKVIDDYLRNKRDLGEKIREQNIGVISAETAQIRQFKPLLDVISNTLPTEGSIPDNLLESKGMVQTYLKSKDVSRVEKMALLRQLSDEQLGVLENAFRDQTELLTLIKDATEGQKAALEAVSDQLKDQLKEVQTTQVTAYKLAFTGAQESAKIINPTVTDWKPYIKTATSSLLDQWQNGFIGGDGYPVIDVRVQIDNQKAMYFVFGNKVLKESAVIYGTVGLAELVFNPETTSIDQNMLTREDILNYAYMLRHPDWIKYDQLTQRMTNKGKMIKKLAGDLAKAAKLPAEAYWGDIDKNFADFPLQGQMIQGAGIKDFFKKLGKKTANIKIGDIIDIVGDVVKDPSKLVDMVEIKRARGAGKKHISKKKKMEARKLTKSANAKIKDDMKAREEQVRKLMNIGAKNAYKVQPISGTGFGQFGAISLDLDKLLNNLTLKAIGEKGDVIIKKLVHPDLIELITKRFNPKKQYNGGAIEDFRKLVRLGKFPAIPSSGKYKILQVPEMSNPYPVEVLPAPIIQNEPKKGGLTLANIEIPLETYVDKLQRIMGSLQAGNNNVDLYNEAVMIADLLLKNDVFTKLAHSKVQKKLMSLMGL